MDIDGGPLILDEQNDPFGRLVKRLRDTDTHKLREDCTKEEFKICAELCFSAMISRQKWNRNHYIVDLSSMVTIADEAFALLTLENNVDEWIDIATKDEDSHKKGTSTRYTGKGTNNDGTKKGWTLDGKKRFNDLYDAVKRDRSTRYSVELEEWLKAEWMIEATARGGTRNVRGEGGEGIDEEEQNRIREEETFVPRSGFEN